MLSLPYKEPGCKKTMTIDMALVQEAFNDTSVPDVDPLYTQ